ncbi:MAG: molybdopterin-guanine dinucleotide biosynthesis protein B [bacterium]
MIPLVSIIGAPGSGKTELITALIKELAKLGRTAGTIKHHAHEGGFDVEGKDSWRHAEAGADEVCVASPTHLAFFRKTGKELSPGEVASWYFAGADIILTEGYRSADTPKIEIIRDAKGAAPEAGEGELIAVVSDGKVATGAPVFGRKETARLAGFINERFPVPEMKNEVRLRVNGKTINLKPFVKAFIGNTVRGMVTTLRGCKNPQNVDIRVGKA